VTITVSPVNDAPEFSPGGDVSVTTVEALAFSAQNNIRLLRGAEL